MSKLGEVHVEALHPPTWGAIFLLPEKDDAFRV